MHLILKDVTKSFYISDTESVEVLRPINLDIPKGDFFVILGPSGCGKTTLLRIMAGLEKPTSGLVLSDGTPVAGPSKERGMVFQAFTSFPWLTVRQNIAFGLNLNCEDKRLIDNVVGKFIKLLGLEGFENCYPKSLSGGMKQRVAIARTLANRPSVLLMDEPFGSLDAQTRWQMQELLLNARRELNSAVVFVTHDVEEAIFLGDRVCILSSRPASIVSEIPIAMGDDRTLDIKRSRSFLDIEQRVLELIRGEVGRIKH